MKRETEDIHQEVTLRRHINDFALALAAGEIDIYNEFSLQHELGIYLRNRLNGCKVQFERNVSYFGLRKSDFQKKEIDISIVSIERGAQPSAIELKYPRNGQVPEQMFGFCKDIRFLEQLVEAGFQQAYFLVIADDHLFYDGDGNGIYGFFRNGTPITGKIRKPTGSRDEEITLIGSYLARWNPISGNRKYCLVEVGIQNTLPGND